MDLSFMETELFGVSLTMLVSIAVKIILIYLLIRLATSLVKHFIRKATKRETHALDKTTSNYLQQILVIVIYVIGVSAIIGNIPGLEKIGSSILASAGILTAAVALASQEALSNFIGGVFIVVGKPFKLGDFIDVDGVAAGTVIEITLRHTVIRNAENRMILIPNSKINSSTITNSTIGDPATCAFIEVGVSYNDDLDKAMELLREEVMKHPNLIDRRSEAEKEAGEPQVKVKVMALGDSSITLRAWAWAASSGDAATMRFDLYKNIKERYDKEGIEIPYPYYNQIIKQA